MEEAPRDFAPPKKCENPVAILFDADSLLQILIAEQMPLLHTFKKVFQVQPAIVEAVEVEIRKSRRFRARFTKGLQKALESETAKVLDVSSISSFASTDPRATYDSIQNKGFEMTGVLDYGEAYTYAAGLVLRSPVVSNDARAIRAAKNAGMDLPTNILRAFDFFVVCHQIGELSVGDCDDIRKTLAAHDEGIPAAFQHASFSEGLGYFYPRLLEISLPRIGRVTPQSELDIRLHLSMIARKI